MDEVEFLMEEYGCDGIVFREDNFTVNKKHVLDICREFHRRRIRLSWQCESRVDTVDREMLDIMRASGCDLIWFGIESGNQKTLDFLDKGITIEQIERVFGWCKELGMKTGATFMIGIPGETKTETMNTYHFAKHLNPNWASFQAYLGLPVSKLYDYVVTHNLYKECIQGIYIVETKEIEVEEIARLETFMNESYPRYRIVKLTENPILRFIFKMMPPVLFKGLGRLYNSLPFPIRGRIKGLVMLNSHVLEDHCAK